MIRLNRRKAWFAGSAVSAIVALLVIFQNCGQSSYKVSSIGDDSTDDPPTDPTPTPTPSNTAVATTCPLTIDRTTVRYGETYTFTITPAAALPSGARAYWSGTRNGTVDITASEIVLNGSGQQSFSYPYADDVMNGSYTRLLTIRYPDGTKICQSNQVTVALLPRLSLAQAQDNISGAGPELVIDRTSGTTYSSTGFASSTNNRDAFLAAWVPSGPVSVVGARFKARMLNGSALGFPTQYTVSVTSPTNSQWTTIGTFSNQPDSNGEVIVGFGSRIDTWGVMIKPTTLGKDNYGGYYLQMDEIELLP